MKKIKGFIIFLCLLCSCTACEKKETLTEEGEINLYYVDNTCYQLVTIPYELESEEMQGQVKEILEELTVSSKKVNYVSAIPEGVAVNNYNITDSTLNMDFNGNYYQMDNIEVVLCKAAMVLTMTQLHGIEYVTFTVNEQTILDEKGNAGVVMKASDFVDNSGSSINAYQELEAVLYYANEGGDRLVQTTYSGLYAQNTSVEKFIIERLMKGATENRLRRTIPAGTKLLSVNTKDGICYVNFDETFLEAAPEITPEVQLYSVVNSLAELSYVNKVQITINGETNIRFRDYVSLEYAFKRNLDSILESEH